VIPDSRLVRLLPIPCFTQIRVLKPSLLTGQHLYIGTGNKGNDTGESDTKKWTEVDKKHLNVKGDKVPARRLLAMHALLAIKHAVVQGWLEPGAITVSEAGWASPGYDSALMRRYLAGATSAAADESQHEEEWEQQDE
jgi:hypothetical protein